MSADITPDSVPVTESKRRKFSRKTKIAAWSGLSAAFAAAAIAGVGYEEQTVSYLQSNFFHSLAKGKWKSLQRQTTDLPAHMGPQDKRRGYADQDKFIARLTKDGTYKADERKPYTVSHLPWIGDLYPVYDEAPQAGLSMLDNYGREMYRAQFPRNVYPSVQAIPPLLINSLSYVEDHSVVKSDYPTQNPAVDLWGMAKAIPDVVEKKLTGHGHPKGGSTLKAQDFKSSHSEGGKTGSPKDKIWQEVSASENVYSHGIDTTQTRKQIVADYLNSVPFGAPEGKEEQLGFLDGLNWFGEDFKEFNRLLMLDQSKLSDDQLRHVAKAYREGMTLIMAVKGTSDLRTQKGRIKLQDRFDKLLPDMRNKGVISGRFESMVLAARQDITYPDPKTVRDANPPTEKSIITLRNDLTAKLGIKPNELDHLDLTAHSTEDQQLNRDIADIFWKMKNEPGFAKANGTVGFQLLSDNPASLKNLQFAFQLERRMPDINGKPQPNQLVSRVDNSSQQLDYNSGTQRELGSTSKPYNVAGSDLGVLYLFNQWKDLAPEQRKQVYIRPDDNDAKWVMAYLDYPGNEMTEQAVIDADFARIYDSDTSEVYFTNGGRMKFDNFEKYEASHVSETVQNGQTIRARGYTKKEALELSINGSMARILRDQKNMVEDQILHISENNLKDPADPRFKELLAQFADDESKVFFARAWLKQRPLPSKDEPAKPITPYTPDQIADLLVAGKKTVSPASLAVIYNMTHKRLTDPSLSPDAKSTAYLNGMTEFIVKHDPAAKNQDLSKYLTYNEERFSHNDLTFLAHLKNPFDLWVARYTLDHPQQPYAVAKGQSPDEARVAYIREENKVYNPAIEASAPVRKSAYTWLTEPKHQRPGITHRQQLDVYTQAEKDAFKYISKVWGSLGYPFPLIPSLASTFGVSGQTPAALAKTEGIFLNGGVRKPTIEFDRLHFAAKTPFARNVTVNDNTPITRVMPKALADKMVDTMHGVVSAAVTGVGGGRVEHGTGWRLHDGLALNDGTVLPIGGKTGTGDNHYNKVPTRTATFMFTIGEDYYGTITVVEENPQLHASKWTSGLATAILKIALPAIARNIEDYYKDNPAARKKLLSSMDAGQIQIEPVMPAYQDPNAIAAKNSLPFSTAAGVTPLTFYTQKGKNWGFTPDAHSDDEPTSDNAALPKENGAPSPSDAQMEDDAHIHDYAPQTPDPEDDDVPAQGVAPAPQPAASSLTPG